MKERIPQRIRDPDRTWMAMAAYNVGIGHLEDARIITQMRKKNPDRWHDVRANLPRLSDPYWHTKVKRGYANGKETVQFVERVTQFAAVLESSVPDKAPSGSGTR
jgi:membrane-bound lytic murein transglycosylase F